MHRLINMSWSDGMKPGIFLFMWMVLGGFPSRQWYGPHTPQREVVILGWWSWTRNAISGCTRGNSLNLGGRCFFFSSSFLSKVSLWAPGRAIQRCARSPSLSLSTCLSATCTSHNHLNQVMDLNQDPCQTRLQRHILGLCFTVVYNTYTDDL